MFLLIPLEEDLIVGLLLLEGLLLLYEGLLLLYEGLLFLCIELFEDLLGVVLLERVDDCLLVVFVPFA